MTDTALSELVTKRDMADAKALGERSGIDSMDDWDDFIHDIAQAIADGRRATEQAALSAQPSAEKAPEWQTMGTAPYDGSTVLLFNNLGNVHIGRWGARYLGDPECEAWVTDGKFIGGTVTHWMPIPPKP